MEDEAVNDLPVRKKRARGPYMLYNDPDKPYIIPRSTVRRQELRSEPQIQQPGSSHQPNGQVHKNQSSSLGENSTLRLSETPDRDVNHDEPAEEFHDCVESSANDVEPAFGPDDDDLHQDCCTGAFVCGKCRTCKDKELQEGTESGEEDELSTKKKDRYNWDELLYPGLKVTKFEVFLMILHIVTRHGQTGPLVEDLLNFVNGIIGENAIPTSRYIFSRLFKPSTAMFFHFFCVNCSTYLGERQKFDRGVKHVMCPTCNGQCNIESLDGGNVFVTLSIRAQLEQIFKRSDFQIVPHLNRPDDSLRDVMDGMLYRQMCEAEQPLSNPHAITITFNTDGASVFKGSKGSLWPIQFYVNETLPEQRMRAENVLLAGLYFGKSSPNMSMFFKPFVEELQDLAVNGVEHYQSDGAVILRPVFAILCSVDSVAKPKVVNMKQFNGANGCGYCKHPNVLLPEIKQLRYLSSEAYPERTHQDMLDDMLEADALDRVGELKKGQETKDSVNGVTGISILLMLPLFHIVYGFGLDYFHALLEGVTKSLVELWFSSDREDFNIKSQLESIDERIKTITPPNSMRRPRSLHDRAKWKAREWRAFLLYYALPCLAGKLPSQYFKHFQSFVIATYILLSESISPENLAKASDMLSKFVSDYNVFYGDRNMVYNVHLCSHLARMVSMYGPLWAYSTFPFESGNGHLLKLVKGTRGVVNQIAKKYVTVKNVPLFCSQYKVSKDVLKFCSDVFSYDYLKTSDKFGNVTTLGVESVGDLTDLDLDAFRKSGLTIPRNNKLPFCNRVIRNDVLFYSRSYSKPKVFDDSCVILNDNSYTVIDKIFKPADRAELYALVKPIRLSATGSLAPHIKCCAHDIFDNPTIVPLKSVVRKCVKISIRRLLGTKG